MALPVLSLNEKFEGVFVYAGKNQSAPYALPGDEVRFRVQRRGRKKKIIIEEIIAHNCSEVETIVPFCPYFRKCGGCRGQHLPYPTQWQLKSSPVLQAWKEKWDLNASQLPAKNQKHYRNRMDFVVEGSVIGLRPLGDFASFTDIEHCGIQSENANEILAVIRRIFADHPCGFNRSHTGHGAARTTELDGEIEDATNPGILKYITIRTGETGCIVLTVQENASSRNYTLFKEKLIEHLKCNDTDSYWSLVETETAALSEISCAPGGNAIYKNASFRAKLAGIEFEVPYDSFFQPNPEAFTDLLEQCKAMLTAIPVESLSSSESEEKQKEPQQLIDLYCGMGLLSRIFASFFPGHYSTVFGFECIESAIKLAERINADVFSRHHFSVQDLNRFDPEAVGLGENLRNSLLIADPPRAGLSPAVKKWIKKTQIPYFLYISCNPISQLSDIGELKQYRPIAAALADCYPHTPHLEAAILLKYKQECT